MTVGGTNTLIQSTQIRTCYDPTLYYGMKGGGVTHTKFSTKSRFKYARAQIYLQYIYFQISRLDLLVRVEYNQKINFS